MRNVLLLHNPAAGGAPTPDLLQMVRRELAFADCRVETRASERAGEITAFCRDASRNGVDRIVVCGGDGTVREAAKGLRGGRVPLALIPLGTSNILGWELGLPVGNPRACAAVAAAGTLREIGLGVVDEAEVFTFCASAGPDSLAVEGVDLNLKSEKGGVAYCRSALVGMLERGLPRLSARTGEGERFEGAQILTLRARRYGTGSIKVSRSADLEASTLRLMVLSRSAVLGLPRLLPAALRGGLEDSPGVTWRDTRSVRIEGTESWPVQADGDLVGNTPATIRCADESLPVVVPIRG